MTDAIRFKFITNLDAATADEITAAANTIKYLTPGMLKASLLQSSNPHALANAILAALLLIDGHTSGLDADKLDGKEAADFVLHSLATADNDFLIGSSSGKFLKKTLSEARAILSPIPFTTQTVNYTLALGDAFTRVFMSSSSPLTVTIPPNSAVAFPIKTEIEIRRCGTGTVNVAPGSGVTIEASGNKYAIAQQHDSVVLVKTGTDTWWEVGSRA